MTKPLFSVQEGFQKYEPISSRAEKWIKDQKLVPFDLAVMYLINCLGKCEAREIIPYIKDGINLLHKKYNPQEKHALNEIYALRVKGLLSSEDKNERRNVLSLSTQGKKLLSDFFSDMDRLLERKDPIETPKDSVKERIRAFLDKHYLDEICRVAGRYPFEKAIYVDYVLLDEFDLDLADMLRMSPTDTMKLFRDVIIDMNYVLFAPGLKLNGDGGFTDRKFSPYIRVKNVPNEYKLLIGAISPDWLEQIIVFEGTIIGKGEKMSRPSIARFLCSGRKCLLEVIQDLFSQEIEKPPICPECGKVDFRFLNDSRSEWVSFQRIEIQENVENVVLNQQNAQFLMSCVDDLCNKAEIGDKVRIVGIPRLLPPKSKGVDYNNYIDVLSIEKTEKDLDVYNITEDEEKQIQKLAKDKKIYEKLIQSVAPPIHGMEDVKEALLLQLFGGRRNKYNPTGGKERSDIHILLIGEPGVAKTKIMGEVAKLWPRSIEASGKGATGCGLTATVIKDESNKGRYVLKAGAIVLANEGLLWIDEFDKMDEEDRKRMNNGMESQVIQINKADITAKMKCETTILAAANPKLERFDKNKPYVQQFGISPSLLSRFDLIFVILDIPNLEADKEIAAKVIANHSYLNGNGTVRPEDKPQIPIDFLRKYIAYARMRIEPIMTEQVKDELIHAYTKIRCTASAGSVPITARQLTGLIRLSEGSAKIRLSKTVEMEDLKRALRILMNNLRAVASDPVTGEIDIDCIMTSHSAQQRNKCKLIERIIREGADRNGLISLGTVLSHAAEKGIDEDLARDIIRELKSNGTIYEPRHNTISIKD